jgi:hypothetical protein
MDNLADSVVTELATQMGAAGLIATRTDLTNLQTTYRSVNGASTIGVSAGLVYSGSNNLQAVLQDLDRAIQHRQVGVEAVQTSITNETTARTNQDTTLQNNINAEAAARGAADAAEAANRDAVDQNHENRLRALEGNETRQATAWGGIKSGGVVYGYNISDITSTGPGSYLISFSTRMLNTNYAVIVTPQSFVMPAVTNKTLDNFTVSFSGGAGALFDFVTIGGNE